MAAYCDVTLGWRTSNLHCLLLIALSLQFSYTYAKTCTTYNSRRQELDRFDCPRRGDDWDEQYCCGTAMKQKCCDYEDYLEENPNIGAGVIIVIIILTLLMLGCLLLAICCCCSCCYLAQRRQRRGLFLATSGVATTTVTANNSDLYPRQQFYQPVAQPAVAVPPHFPNSAPTYQNAALPANVYIPQPQPEYEKPPPYYSN